MQITTTKKNVELHLIRIGQENFFKISDVDEMRPFFMSIVSDSDHWMFIASNGGLSAGRKDAEHALFPYYTDDKITEAADITGSKSIFQIKKDGQSHLWEPFSERYEGRYHISRNLYKNAYGNKVLFEEINHDLSLVFRYQWSSSEKYGFVKSSALINQGHSDIQVNLVDGIQNIIPAGVNSDLQRSSSNLVDAYKRCELEKDAGLGIYSLSAIIVDRAEPSEALKANIVWSLGLDNPTYLLSSRQLRDFRRGHYLQEEYDVKAEKGAYFINQEITLDANTQKEWLIVTDVNKNHAAISHMAQEIKSNDNLYHEVLNDIEQGTQNLIRLNASADALQISSDKLRDTRHFANTLFNIMRGGIFDNNYQIEKEDFLNYLSKANKAVFQAFAEQIRQFDNLFSLAQLQELARKCDNPNFKRLCFEYLPLKFSRRHGDPSRPWNKFSINTRSEEDGSKILDYEGNWRDIFQNWEALAQAYPDFVESMIHKFLNATTFDGYNPYRVTKGGFDWETIEADDPWSYIGYWGDHQIIYLLKFLEFIHNHQPGRIQQLFEQEIFVYANVPYIIKSYEDTLKNPKDTIDFDEVADHEIRKNRDKLGADGALLTKQDGEIYQVNFIEKILATTLAKLSNFIIEGGIWMNTQRPEWNDANNALVGNGVSMVTLYYLRRFLSFFDKLLADSVTKEVNISEETAEFYRQIYQTFTKFQHLLTETVSDYDRKSVLDHLGAAGSQFRSSVYSNGFSGSKRALSLAEIRAFIAVSLQFIDKTIVANKRADKLYHAYNLMTVESSEAVSINYLSEMLEGQVAVLSSGHLSSEAALEVLDGLKNSALFRDDQYSYILYPNKDLPRFVDKNTIPRKSVVQSELLTELLNDGNLKIIEQDIKGGYHFNGNFKNADDLAAALEELSLTAYAPLVDKEKQAVLLIFEEVFNHKAFTGRSGTFFGYEGLGSIYWHMVSKLLLATQECCLKAVNEGASPQTVGRLLEHYYEINAGIGVHKPPTLYGAFPTDPYSHTPAGKGAQQPGMTGQVKEDILCRFGELGVFTKNGQLSFSPFLLRKEEFLTEEALFDYVDIHATQQSIALSADSLAFTYCQVPVVYHKSDYERLSITRKDGSIAQFTKAQLDIETSRQVFGRTGEIVRIDVWIAKAKLK